MYRLKCRRVTGTENIATATCKNDRLMRVNNTSHAKKLRLNLLKKELPVEDLLRRLSINCRLNYIYLA